MYVDSNNSTVWVEKSEIKIFQKAINHLGLKCKEIGETYLIGVLEFEVLNQRGEIPSGNTFFALGKIMVRFGAIEEMLKKK